MASAIDPTLAGDMTADGREVRKSEVQEQFQVAKDEIDALQSFDDAPILGDFSETSPAANVSGAVTRSFTDGNVHRLTLTGNVTSLTIQDPPPSGQAGTFTVKIIQDGTGGWTWAHPSGTVWSGGAAPTLSTDASDVSWLTYVTDDGGTTWYGFVGGIDFS